ncbi:hypothetical protein BH09PLA1_BH09PLA1_24160 [soil metagenome]
MLYSFHLAEIPLKVGLNALLRPPTAPRLRHAEMLAFMLLGSPIISTRRLQLGKVAMFAEWEDEGALESFLAEHALGVRLATGWHVRMQFLRRYGSIAALSHLPVKAADWDVREPVVAVTIARMKLFQVPRFLRWGRPVERLVRDHPGQVFSMAAQRPPRTISTFSIWKSITDMTDMVHGRQEVPHTTVHRLAMAEQRRKDFHHESTFMRFRPLSEHGTWQGRPRLLPQ